jgi:GNAT superfamily N-acetyltransferase
MDVEIIEISAGHLPAITDCLRKEWGSEQVVTRGKMLDASRLPGFVALDGTNLLGLITFHVRGLECEIVTLNAFVGNLGIGTRLIDQVKKTATQDGLTRIWLITTNDNTEALRFYQKRGFEIVAVHRNAIEISRRLKPTIPFVGLHGIPIRDEIELEYLVESTALKWENNLEKLHPDHPADGILHDLFGYRSCTGHDGRREIQHVVERRIMEMAERESPGQNAAAYPRAGVEICGRERRYDSLPRPGDFGPRQAGRSGPLGQKAL